MNHPIHNIAVCGLGKLGACVAAALASRGFNVIGFDIDGSKVQALAGGRAPLEEPGLQQLVTRSKRRLKATTDLRQVVQGSQACFFITPTPSLPDGSFNNDYLAEAVRSVAHHVRSAKKKNYLFVLNSTVTPGSCEAVFKPLLEQALGGKCGRDFGLCYNPEFIALGNVLEGLLRPDLVLIGESDLGSGKRLEHVYRKLCVSDSPIERMSLVSAELAKISVNCAVTMKISFVNQLSAVCARIPGSDPAVILQAIGKDRRIGSDYLKPGLGYGGPCFPRDNRLFQYTAEKAGVYAALAEATDKVNAEVNQRLLQTVLQHASHGPIAVLGLAYKPFTSVTECSPGLWLAQELARLNRTVLAHDYAASSLPSSAYTANGHLLQVSDPNDVFRRKCRTFVISCPWPQYQRLFQSPDFDPKSAVIIDPWGLLKQSGLDTRAAMYLNTLV